MKARLRVRSRGSLAIFFTRPTALGLFIVMVLFVLSPLASRALRRLRRTPAAA